MLLRPLALAVLIAMPGGAALADATLFRNVRVFDGVSPELSGPVEVLVRDNLIERISAEPIPPEATAGAKVVEGAGGTLMPGLIDAHTHLAMSTIGIAELMIGDPNYLTLRAGKAAEEELLRGFTTARDMGGPTFGLKRAIDEGYVAGPRIYPSGAMISQTSGHGDFRMITDLPRRDGDLDRSELFGFAAVADGREEVLRRTREQLFLGASQIKVMAGGGVSSDHDPLDSAQYTEDELRAAVEAAADWNTYVAVHAYTPAAIQKAIDAGVKVIEHGHLADDATAKLMAEKGVWWSMQPFLDDEHAIPFPEGSRHRADQLRITDGTENAYALAKKYGVKLAWGTDTLFSKTLASQQAEQLTKMVRWFTPAEVLKMATHDNAELLALSGPRNPYPGRLGVVEEGALADLLLVRGDVLADIDLLNDQANLAVIMKDGRIFKDTTTGAP